MLARPSVLSAYESMLSPSDMQYLRAELGDKFLADTKITFSLICEEDFATDVAQFRVEWWAKGDKQRKKMLLGDLESVCTTLRAITTMEL